MRKVIVNEFMSLDGVTQAPGGVDEDTSGGFEHGGWHLRYFDDVSRQRVLEGIVEAGGFLLGRRTYEIFAAYWPNASEEEQVIAEPLNTKPKHVVSTTLREPLEWQNATLLQGDVAEAVAALRQDDGADLHVIGSTELVRALIEHSLIDELRLTIDPVVLGGGKRIFRDDGVLRPLRLVDAEVTSTGRSSRPTLRPHEGTLALAKLIYSAIASLDGYIEDEDGEFDWAEPDRELHTFINDLERRVGTYLYGRRLYEVMAAWETMPLAEQPRFMRDFAQVWRAAEKIVYSKTLEAVSTARTRIERDFDAQAVRQLKAEAQCDLMLGGPALASEAFKAGLVDECHLFLAPILVGGGKRSLPDDVRLKLELLDERRFGNGMVYLRYRTALTAS